ncbi:MAG: MFS transporter [Deltaproteobacteria bacterium]|nr:MFS transporter [Deltaproteobacteria bacterium]
MKTPAGAAAPSARPATRVAFAALHHRAYRAYFSFTLCSMMADNIEHVISYWVIFQAFHSPLLGGYAVISHWVPFLLFSVYSGTLADRFDCRRLLQISQAMYIVVSLAWGLLFLTGSLQVWHAVVLLLVHGLAGVLLAPATQMLIHDIVGPEYLQSAVRLNATGRQLGILLGPAVGGGLMLLLGPPAGLLANALIYLPLTLWLQAMPYTGHTREGARGGRAGGFGLGEAVRVLREVSADRTIVAMAALAGLSALLVGNAFQAQMPEYANDLGTDEAGFAYSALLAANATGAVIGGLVLEGTGLLRPRARTAIICASLWCLAIAGFAAARSYPLALGLLFLAGIFNLAFSSMAQTLVQLLAPGHLRGRVIGLFNMSQNGLRFGSGVTVGVLGSVIGIHWSLGLSAAALLVVTLGLLAFVAPRDTGASPYGPAGLRLAPGDDRR